MPETLLPGSSKNGTGSASGHPQLGPSSPMVPAGGGLQMRSKRRRRAVRVVVLGGQGRHMNGHHGTFAAFANSARPSANARARASIDAISSGESTNSAPAMTPSTWEGLVMPQITLTAGEAASRYAMETAVVVLPRARAIIANSWTKSSANG